MVFGVHKCVTSVNMLFEFAWWTFWFHIFCHVRRACSVRIFENTVPHTSNLITAYQPQVVSKTCLLIPKYGPCRSKIPMWFYNPALKNCSRFTWGGCQGNGNRFDNFEDCWGYCISKPDTKKYIPRYCSLSFDYGYCFGAVERYYYDSAWKVCKTTLYSGCGGNKNNFYNLEQCETICRFGKGAITTKKSVATGGPRKILVINPWNTTPRRGKGQAIVPSANQSATAG